MVPVPWEAAGLALGEVELIFHLEITSNYDCFPRCRKIRGGCPLKEKKKKELH